MASPHRPRRRVVAEFTPDRPSSRASLAPLMDMRVIALELAAAEAMSPRQSESALNSDGMLYARSFAAGTGGGGTGGGVVFGGDMLYKDVSITTSWQPSRNSLSGVFHRTDPSQKMLLYSTTNVAHVDLSAERVICEVSLPDDFASVADSFVPTAAPSLVDGRNTLFGVDGGQLRLVDFDSRDGKVAKKVFARELIGGDVIAMASDGEASMLGARLVVVVETSKKKLKLCLVQNISGFDKLKPFCGFELPSSISKAVGEVVLVVSRHVQFVYVARGTTAVLIQVYAGMTSPEAGDVVFRNVLKATPVAVELELPGTAQLGDVGARFVTSRRSEWQLLLTVGGAAGQCGMWSGTVMTIMRNRNRVAVEAPLFKRVSHSTTHAPLGYARPTVHFRGASNGRRRGRGTRRDSRLGGEAFVFGGAARASISGGAEIGRVNLAAGTPDPQG
eukprot:m.11870 g.11870  ORF g.11870 m.11870 type:complete len:446 (+) comp7551_c0_seq1:109-1446(+)